MCRVYLHQATMVKSNNRKKCKIILVFGKATQAIVKVLVAVRIKKILVQVKPQH